jgi:phospholipase D1/2
VYWNQPNKLPTGFEGCDRNASGLPVVAPRLRPREPADRPRQAARPAEEYDCLGICAGNVRFVNPGPESRFSPPAARTRARWRLAVISLAVIGAALVIWRFTPLAEWATAQRMTLLIAELQNAWWGPLAVVALYIVGGVIVFPITLLIAATAVVFEPLSAVALSFVGVLANAIVTYVIGATLVRGTMHAAFDRTVQQVNAALKDRGVVAVAVIRNVPLAPFTFVNMAMGAVGVRLHDYLIGTALGIAPGIVAFSVFGHQLRAILSRPTFANIALLAIAILGWAALSVLLQALISRRNAHKARNAKEG